MTCSIFAQARRTPEISFRGFTENLQDKKLRTAGRDCSTSTRLMSKSESATRIKPMATLTKLGCESSQSEHRIMRKTIAVLQTRQREQIMKRFKSARQAQRFLSLHDQVANLFHIPYPESVTADFRRTSRERAFLAWREISKTGAAD
jgi:hypothetical protein